MASSNKKLEENLQKGQVNFDWLKKNNVDVADLVSLMRKKKGIDDDDDDDSYIEEVIEDDEEIIEEVVESPKVALGKGMAIPAFRKPVAVAGPAPVPKPPPAPPASIQPPKPAAAPDSSKALLLQSAETRLIEASNAFCQAIEEGAAIVSLLEFMVDSSSSAAASAHAGTDESEEASEIRIAFLKAFQAGQAVVARLEQAKAQLHGKIHKPAAALSLQPQGTTQRITFKKVSKKPQQGIPIIQEGSSEDEEEEEEKPAPKSKRVEMPTKTELPKQIPVTPVQNDAPKRSTAAKPTTTKSSSTHQDELKKAKESMLQAAKEGAALVALLEKKHQKQKRQPQQNPVAADNSELAQAKKMFLEAAKQGSELVSSLESKIIARGGVPGAAAPSTAAITTAAANASENNSLDHARHSFIAVAKESVNFASALDQKLDSPRAATSTAGQSSDMSLDSSQCSLGVDDHDIAKARQSFLNAAKEGAALVSQLEAKIATGEDELVKTSDEAAPTTDSNDIQPITKVKTTAVTPEAAPETKDLNSEQASNAAKEVTVEKDGTQSSTKEGDSLELAKTENVDFSGRPNDEAGVESTEPTPSDKPKGKASQPAKEEPPVSGPSADKAAVDIANVQPESTESAPPDSTITEEIPDAAKEETPVSTESAPLDEQPTEDVPEVVENEPPIKTEAAATDKPKKENPESSKDEAPVSTGAALLSKASTNELSRTESSSANDNPAEEIHLQANEPAAVAGEFTRAATAEENSKMDIQEWPMGASAAEVSTEASSATEMSTKELDNESPKEASTAIETDEIPELAKARLSMIEASKDGAVLVGMLGYKRLCPDDVIRHMIEAAGGEEQLAAQEAKAASEVEQITAEFFHLAKAANDAVAKMESRILLKKYSVGSASQDDTTQTDSEVAADAKDLFSKFAVQGINLASLAKLKIEEEKLVDEAINKDGAGVSIDRDASIAKAKTSFLAASVDGIALIMALLDLADIGVATEAPSSPAVCPLISDTVADEREDNSATETTKRPLDEANDAMPVDFATDVAERESKKVPTGGPESLVVETPEVITTDEQLPVDHCEGRHDEATAGDANINEPMSAAVTPCIIDVKAAEVDDSSSGASEDPEPGAKQAEKCIIAEEVIDGGDTSRLKGTGPTNDASAEKAGSKTDDVADASYEHAYTETKSPGEQAERVEDAPAAGYEVEKVADDVIRTAGPDEPTPSRDGAEITANDSVEGKTEKANIEETSEKVDATLQLTEANVNEKLPEVTEASKVPHVADDVNADNQGSAPELTDVDETANTADKTDPEHYTGVEERPALDANSALGEAVLTAKETHDQISDMVQTTEEITSNGDAKTGTNEETKIDEKKNTVTEDANTDSPERGVIAETEPESQETAHAERLANARESFLAAAKESARFLSFLESRLEEEVNESQVKDGVVGSKDNTNNTDASAAAQNTNAIDQASLREARSSFLAAAREGAALVSLMAEQTRQHKSEVDAQPPPPVPEVEGNDVELADGGVSKEKPKNDTILEASKAFLHATALVSRLASVLDEKKDNANVHSKDGYEEEVIEEDVTGDLAATKQAFLQAAKEGAALVSKLDAKFCKQDEDEEYEEEVIEDDARADFLQAAKAEFLVFSKDFDSKTKL